MSENDQIESARQEEPATEPVLTDAPPEAASAAEEALPDGEKMKPEAVTEEPPAETSAPEEPSPKESGAEESSGAEPEPAQTEESSGEPEAVEADSAEATAADEPGDGAGEGPPSAGVPGMDWYIIHTYSGFENKVKESLLTRGDAFGLGDRIGEILIPTEDVVEMRNGKKVRSKRLLYPGYVLIQLKMDDELWHVVKNTPRVTSFVGSGQTPTPLSADEVNQILYRQTTSAEKPRPKMTFERNDRVKIIDGPFSNFTGSIEEVNEDRSTLKVMVTIFGRGTPVELEYFQVEKEKV